MSGGGSFQKSDAENQSKFSQDVFEPQAEAMQGFYNQLPEQYRRSFSGLNSQVDDSVRDNQLAYDNADVFNRDQSHGGVYQDMGNANRLKNSLDQSLNSPSNMQSMNNMIMGGSGNNYADAMKNSYIDDANLATNNMLANTDARAAASGMSGGSRHGVAQAQGTEDINRNLQRNLAETGYNTFDKDLDRKLNIASQADQATLARQGMLQGMIGQQGAMTDRAIDRTGQLQGYRGAASDAFMKPWDAANAYGNAIGAPTVLNSGSASGSSSGLGMSSNGGVSGVSVGGGGGGK